MNLKLKLWFIESIQGRLTLASLLLLPLVCGALAWTLDQAFKASLLKSQENQMTSQAYALIASTELEEGVIWLPEYVTDDRLNQASSDVYALVFDHIKNQLVWQSQSSPRSFSELEGPATELLLGKPDFSLRLVDGIPMFQLNYLIEWEDEASLLPIRFVVLQSDQAYQQALAEYRNTLWFWLSLVAVVLVVLQLLVLKWGLRQVESLSEDLAAVKKGETDSLKGDYPLELRSLTESVNSLIAHESHQRERYRNTLADLAHSIKNPSAIIASALSSAKTQVVEKDAAWLSDIQEQNERIDQILSYQLTRAVSGGAAPFSKAIYIKPLCEKVCGAMQKVYFDKSINLQLEVEDASIFRGDEGDLMELLGNLIDNAFKYGSSKVKAGVYLKNSSVNISIEDDGRGMTELERSNLVKRGQRADTTVPGQGIGLAVVNDIVESYAGELSLSESEELGGLQVLLRFKV